MQRPTRRSTSLALFLQVFLMAGAVQAASAALLYAPQPHPDAAAPGTSVRVDGFPELDPTCPSVDMWLATDLAISALDDPRLIPLQGTVTVEEGMGQKSAGELVDVPVFTFGVPAVPAGAYLMYFSCPGSTNGWDSLFAGAAFTVLDPLPGTDMPRGNPMAVTPVAALRTVGALLLVSAAALLLRRRRVA